MFPRLVGRCSQADGGASGGRGGIFHRCVRGVAGLPGEAATGQAAAPGITGSTMEGGAFLNDMAGKTVFQLASAYPLLFSLLSRWQGVLVRHWPDVLIRMLFASAQAGDQHLVADKGFRQMVTHALTDCFDGNVAGYVRDVRAYVSPWAHTLKEVRTPTHPWHGEADNWTPKEMSAYLAKQIASCASLNRLPGLSPCPCLFSAPGKHSEFRRNSGRLNASPVRLTGTIFNLHRRQIKNKKSSNQPKQPHNGVN